MHERNPALTGALAVNVQLSTSNSPFGYFYLTIGSESSQQDKIRWKRIKEKAALILETWAWL